MKKKTFAYLILLIGVVLLAVSLFDLFFNNPKQTNVSGLISNVLLIVLMVVNIRDLNKNEKRQE
jgi:amino acid transporter